MPCWDRGRLPRPLARRHGASGRAARGPRGGVVTFVQSPVGGVPVLGSPLFPVRPELVEGRVRPPTVQPELSENRLDTRRLPRVPHSFPLRLIAPFDKLRANGDCASQPAFGNCRAKPSRAIAGSCPGAAGGAVSRSAWASRRRPPRPAPAPATVDRSVRAARHRRPTLGSSRA